MNLKSFTYLDQVDFGLHIDIYVDEQTAQVSDKYIVLSWKKLNKLETLSTNDKGNMYMSRLRKALCEKLLK